MTQFTRLPSQNYREILIDQVYQGFPDAVGPLLLLLAEVLFELEGEEAAVAVKVVRALQLLKMKA